MSPHSPWIPVLLTSLTLACADGGTSSPGGGDAGPTRDAAPDQDSLPVDEDLAVRAVNPTGGPEGGGTTVVISGAGFEEGATVAFGSAPATGVTVNNSRSIRATAPAGMGIVGVTVTNPGGEAQTLAMAYTYRAPIADAVDWCIVQFPPTLAAAPGVAAGPVFARVFEESCTEGEATCGRVQAELGYGPLGEDISQAPERWTWLPAALNPAHTSDNNDEFSASVTVGLPGEYGYAYRMRINDGAWTYCDLDGTDNGFQPEQVGRLSVQEGVQAIGWCGLHFPPTLSTQPGVETEPVFGRVFMAGCTEGGAACDLIEAELGWGDPLVDPSADPEAWAWRPTAYNPAHVADDNDEHLGTITPPEAGAFAYAWRVSLDGEAWTYCDLDGSDNGFQSGQAGRLTVAEDTVEVGWCALQFPAAAEAAVGQATEIYGRAFVEGCTEGDAQCPVLLGQLGYGPGDDPAAFEWIDAAYNPGHTVDDNDEHVATIEAAVEGALRYAFRFSVDGEAWTLCDLDGSDNDFAADQMGTLTVADPQLEVGWCTLQFPARVEVDAGDPLPIVYGRAFVADCTEGEQRCEALRGQLGVAPVVEGAVGDPMWIDAEYNAAHTVDDNDEWQAPLAAMGAGEFRYWYRFSVDGEAWQACDLDGTDNGFEVAEAGALVIREPVVEVPTVDWCEVRHPPATSTAPGVATEAIFGQVLVGGCTDGAARCEAVMAQVGHGPADTPPAADWTWGPAEYNAEHQGDDNDEYAGVITIPAAGTYGYGYRFSVDAGDTWTYCDTTGDDGALESVPQVVVVAREIGWCTIQFPAELVGAPGDGVGPIFGRAFVEGCTELGARCSGLRMQVGLGAADTDPRVDAWRWTEGAYNPGHVADNNDEFSANVELGDGHALFAVRFSGDGGTTWTYCDTDGGELSLEALGTVRPAE